MQIPKICISAWASGSGKTMLTCGLIRVLQRKGMKVQSFKAGPDYIDPLFHDAVEKAAGGVTGVAGAGGPVTSDGGIRHCENLDTFFMDHEGVRRIYEEASRGADISVIEGVMGLFDGLGGVESSGSTYDLASALDAPVILVVDASKASKTLAALVSGMLAHDEKGLIRGIILNKCSRELCERLTPHIEGADQAAGLWSGRSADGNKGAAGNVGADGSIDADMNKNPDRNAGASEKPGTVENDIGDRAARRIRVYGYVPRMKDMGVGSRYLGLTLPGEVVDINQKIDRLADVLEESVDIDGIIKDCSCI